MHLMKRYALLLVLAGAFFSVNDVCAIDLVDQYTKPVYGISFSTESPCPICFDAKQDVRLCEPCGHAICKDCAQAWLCENITCPFCRKKLKKILRPVKSSIRQQEKEPVPNIISVPVPQPAPVSWVRSVAVIAPAISRRNIDYRRFNLDDSKIDLKWQGLKTENVQDFLLLIPNKQSIEELNLDGNQLPLLPAEIGLLTNLKILTFVCNRLTTLPQAVLSLPNLERIFIGLNSLDEESLRQLDILESRGVKVFGRDDQR